MKGVTICQRRDGSTEYVASMTIRGEKKARSYSSFKYGEEKAYLMSCCKRLIFEYEFGKKTLNDIARYMMETQQYLFYTDIIFSDTICGLIETCLHYSNSCLIAMSPESFFLYENCKHVKTFYSKQEVIDFYKEIIISSIKELK